MNLDTIETAIQRLQKVGQAGALPKNATVPELVDGLQRQLGAVGDALRLLFSELKGTPRFPRDSNLFLVDARSTSSTNNILSTAQATTEGFGATAGLAIYHHGLGVKLDRYVISYCALANSGAADPGYLNGQFSRTGGIRIYSFDSNRTVFQIDQDAQDFEAVFVVSCYGSSVIPSSLVNKGQGTKTGASTPQLGTITASAATDLP